MTSSPVRPAISCHRARAVAASPGLPTSAPSMWSIESQPTTTASGSRSATRLATAVAFAPASAVTASAADASGQAGEQGVLVDVGDLDLGLEPRGPQDRQPGGGGGGEHELHDGRR